MTTIESQHFLKQLKIAATCCASASDSLTKASSLLNIIRQRRKDARLSRKEGNSACLGKDALLICYKKEAEDLKKKAKVEAHQAAVTMFFHPQYNLQLFENLLGFLQRLPPKQAAETLNHMIAIVTNHEIETFMQEEETKIARGKKSFWVVPYFRLMEFVVKTALFCERIKFEHKLNFSTNFLGFRVASLQCQGKMAQMRSIAFERLEMFQKRRHNLLTISAFLCFLFRKIFTFPNNFVSLQMKRLLEK